MRLVFCFVIICLSYAGNSIAQTVSILPIERNGKWGLITNEGLVVVSPTYDDVDVTQTFGSNFIVTKDGKKGLVNYKGDIHIPIEYDDIDYTKAGVFIVRKNNMYGIFTVDEKATEVEFDQIEYLYYGAFKVRKNDKYGIYEVNYRSNKVLNIKIEAEYDEIYEVSRQVYFLKKGTDSYVYHVSDKSKKDLQADSVRMIRDYSNIMVYRNGKVGLYDYLFHTLIIQPEYDSINTSFKTNGILVYNNGLAGLYTTKGQRLLNTEWTNINITNSSGDFQMEKEGQQYLFDIRNNTVYGPFDFKKLNLHHNAVVVEANNKFGLYSLSGDQLLEASYDTLRPDAFWNFIVKKNGRYGICSNKGELLFSPVANNIVYTRDFYIIYIGNKYGILGINGKMIIEPIYDELEYISNAKVYYARQGDYYGIIGPSAKAYTTITYDSLRVSEDLTKLYKNKKVTVLDIDDNGGLVDVRTFTKFNTLNVNASDSTISFRKSDADPSRSMGCSWQYDYKKNNWTYINARDTGRVKPTYDIAVGRCECYYTRIANVRGQDTLWGIYDVANMKELLSPSLRQIYNTSYYICNVFWGKTLDNKICAIDLKGNIHTEFPYKRSDTTLYFTAIEIGQVTNLTSVKLRNSAGLEKWGYVDNDFVVKIFPQYDEAMSFEYNTEEGKGMALQAAPVRKGDIWGVIDYKGQIVVPFQFEQIQKKYGKTYVGKINRPAYGFVDSMGTVICQPYYHYAYEFKNGWARVKFGEYWNFIDKKGKPLTSQTHYLNVRDFGAHNALVETSEGWKLVNRKGAVSDKASYAGIDSCEAGGTYVITPKGYGYVNADYDLVVPAVYSSFSKFYKQKAVAHSKKGHGLFTMTGEWLVDPSYYYMSDIDSSGMIIYRREGRFKTYGVMSYTGKIITHQKFEEIRPYHEGLAAAKYDGKWGYLNTDGKWAIHPKYMFARDFYQGKAVIRASYNQFSLIDKKGKIIAKSVKLDSIPQPKADVYKAKIESEEILYITLTKPENISSKHFTNFTIIPEGSRFRIKSNLDTLSTPLDGISRFSGGYARIWINSSVALLNMDLYKAEADIDYPYDKIEQVDSHILKVYRGGHFGYYNMYLSRWIWHIQ